MARSFLAVASILLTKFAFQSIQAALPELPDTAKPILQFGETGWIELIDSVLPIHPGPHEVRLLQNLKMLGNRRRADCKPVRDLAGRQFSGGEHLDDPLASWVGQSRDTQHPVIMKHLFN
jgi:hypothetical protein